MLMERDFEIREVDGDDAARSAARRMKCLYRTLANGSKANDDVELT